MTDQSGLQPSEGEGKTTLYRPDGEGGLDVAPRQGDYREGLRSRRWNAAPLENPEAQKTDGRIVVGIIILLSIVTFVVLVVGYGAGVWGLPA